MCYKLYLKAITILKDLFGDYLSGNFMFEKDSWEIGFRLVTEQVQVPFCNMMCEELITDNKNRELCQMPKDSGRQRPSK